MILHTGLVPLETAVTGDKERCNVMNLKFLENANFAGRDRETATCL